MFSRIADWLALTSTERRVLMFLSITLAIGAGIRVYRSTRPEPPPFDYAHSDSTFAALSTSVAAADTASADDPDEPPVNINTATRDELMELPGIGASMADRILQYRSDHGAFSLPEQLRKVKGIGTKKFGKLRPHITVGPPTQRKNSP
jgi:comEA protein